MTPKLVIFDCDGVLVDSELITNQLLRDDLAGRGLDRSVEEIMSLFVGGTMRGVSIQAREMGADIPDDWVEYFYKRLYQRLGEGTPLISGVEQVLDSLDAKGIPYAVGSNGSEEKMGITLGQHPSIWTRLKDNLFSAHTLGVAKPDPGLYLAVAAAFDLTPDDCVVVDDSPSGCRGAVAAGIKCLGFAEHDDGARLLAEGAHVFHKMDALPELLRLTG